MSKQAIQEKRGNIFMVPPENLTLVTDKNHPLYDPRVEIEPNESMILNIMMHGILQPVLTRKNGELVEVVAGRQRVKAALEANRRLTAEGKLPLLVPTLVKRGTDVNMFGVLVSENEIRKEDSLLIKCNKACKLSNMGYDISAIATTFGVSEQTINNWFEIEQLSPELREAIETGEISATAALQFAGLSREQQNERYKEMKKQGDKLSTRNVKTAVESKDSKPAPKMKTRKAIKKRLDKYDKKNSAYHKAYCEALLWVLGEEEISEDK